MKKVFYSAALATLVMIGGCKKDNTTQEPAFGTVTDIDGNTYQTVKIGTQVWMMENLKTAHYNDGMAIPNITDGLQWQSTATGAYCYYDNDPSNNTTYGKLYNWYAVNTNKLAPSGWHVPTQAEWQTLLTYLGGALDCGGKLKSTSSLWTNPNTGADNSSHFSALPGGYRENGSGTYTLIGKLAEFWTATGNTSTDNAYECTIYYNSVGVHYTTFYNNGSGHSIRCVQD